MKLKDLIQARKAIDAHIYDKVPASLAYKLMKFLKASDNEDAFYNEKMNKIIEEHGERDGDGQIKLQDNRILLKQKSIAICNDEIQKIQETQVKKPDFMFDISELEPIKLSIAEISSLDDFINDKN